MRQRDQLFQRICTSQTQDVLATIVNVEGSAYVREGSMLLIKENGERCGIISGGCLEEDVVMQAEKVRRQQKAIICTYNMREDEDPIWGEEVGCGGVISILIEPVTEQLKDSLLNVQHWLGQRQTVVHAKILCPDGKSVENFFSPRVDQLENRIELGKDVYKMIIRPTPHLIIFGAGQDVQPLVSFAADTGFYVTVYDWREGFIKRDQFLKADYLFGQHLPSLLKETMFQSYDFSIIMTHNFQKDQEILQHLLQQDLPYIGVLGTKKRTQRLINNNQIPKNLHFPIGLPIGAKGPEEIAISILGELIQEWRKNG
ncbi:XdhC family protein [Priestia koreensis]|uniref:XdhC family protein n=1 Tax=Priestia koreensis TaxID=284581 RepID=UPI001F578EF1|nr:XdhC family protein [Priestia koreensis]UNL86298.1 XdhC family protein [Priestia koreensis]